MRAIIVATGASTEPREMDEQLSASLPNCMLTLVDRPFLQHVVEYLIGRGFTEFDFVLSRAPEKIERLLGDGTRWGSRFHFHLARDPQRPYELLKVIGGDWANEPFLLAHADYLPRLAFDEAIGFTPCLFYPQPHTPEDELEWTGWAWLTPSELMALPNGINLRQFEMALLACSLEKRQVQKLARVFSVRNRADLLAAQAALLQNEFTELLLTGRECTPHLRLGRNAQVHPTAKLIAPVFIGADTQIGEGCVIGPNAVIEDACLIERDCIIQEATVLAHSYVGAGVTLEQTIVQGNELDNLRVGARLTVTNEFLLDHLATPPLGQWVRRLSSRVFASLLLVLTAPLLLCIWAWRKYITGVAVWQWQTVVALPASKREQDWMTFELLSFADSPATPGEASSWRFWYLQFLPGLWNVAQGDLQFWGTRPRTYAEIKRMADDWRALYLQSRPGLLYEADPAGETESAEGWPTDLLSALIRSHAARF